MKILKQEKKDSIYLLEIEAPFEDFKKSQEKVIIEYTKEAEMPGFRKGKAPRNLIEKSLNPEVVSDRAAQNLIADLYPKIIKETKIDPIDYPRVELKNLKEGEPFVFLLEVEVYPDVKLGEYKNIKISKKSFDVAEEDLNYALGSLQNRVAKYNDAPDAVCQKDDILSLEIQTQIDSSEINVWPRKVTGFQIGKELIHSEFDSNIYGLKTNEEKTFTINFPSDSKIEAISGKTVTFKIKIVEIKRKELLEIDDEFAKKVSGLGTLAELKEELKRSIEIEKKEEAESDLKNQLIEAVSKNSEVLVPKSIIRIETNIIIEELASSLAKSNLTFEGYLKSLKKTEEEIRAELLPAAIARAKSKIFLKKIAEVENLAPTEYDIDTEIALIASSEDKTVEEYKKSMREETLLYLKDYIMRRKALDFLISNAQIETK